MRGSSIVSMVVVVLLCWGGYCGASSVIMQCDVGGCGPLQAGWTGLAACGTHTNVAGTGINVTLATGNPGACECRNPGGTGTLAAVEADLLFANDEKNSPGSDFIITFSNLTAGASYRLLSYHNRSDEGATTIPLVTVTGATNVSVPAFIVQDHPIMDNPAEIMFTAGAGDVSIRYKGPDGGCAGCQVFLNGFVLEYAGPTVGFESQSSGAIETIGTAGINVALTNPEPGQTYTVNYTVVGGTAQGGGVDYTIVPGTLTFYPGDTVKTIDVSIVNDGVPEDDETILLELSNPTGLNVAIGIANHTFTISDTRPKVSFTSASLGGVENVGVVNIAVKLSLVSDQTVTVQYGVTGGTATNGVDYSVLGSGVLTFDPGVVTQTIGLSITDDSVVEPQETIQLTLSNPVNATLGTIPTFTYSIIDNEQGVVWDGLVWYYSGNTSELFVNADGDLEWSPNGGEQFMTRLPEKRLSQTGDVVELTYWWMTNGDHSCPDCFACPGCFDDSIECIAGTSDMRVGLFEADGEYVQSDGFSVTGSSIFAGYKGYEFRFGPNMKSGPTRWVDCTNEVHKTGNFCKKPQSLDNLMYTNDGLEDYIPGFELPPGEYSLFTVRLERTSSSSIKLTITLHDRPYSWTDTSSSEQPSKIDVLAVHMRNHRPYSRLVLGKLCKMAADFDGNDVVDAKDLAHMAEKWLLPCFPVGNYCEGADMNQDRKVNLRDFSLLAGDWLKTCGGH